MDSEFIPPKDKIKYVFPNGESYVSVDAPNIEGIY